MEAARTYFTWPDGVLGYQCRGCAVCCKGLGIGLDAPGGQVARLVELYPGLAGFLRKRGSTWTAFNPRGRCWFLDAEGMCAIEVGHGRRVKPASCRLFPFNRVFRIGETQIVDYNSVICPLEIAGDSGLHAVTHAEVLGDIEAIADDAIVGTQLRVDGPERDGRAFVERESVIASACFAAAREVTPEVEPVWSPHRSGLPALEEAAAALSAARQILLGRALRRPTGATLRHALLLTPSLRFNELFGPRGYEERSALEGVLPAMWLAWLSFVADGAELAGRDLGMQEITSIWGEQAALAYLLARWHERPALARGPVELPGSADPDGVVRRFGEACVRNRGRTNTLGELLAPLFGERKVTERVVLARMMEPLFVRMRFAGSAAARDERRPGKRRRRRK